MILYKTHHITHKKDSAAQERMFVGTVSLRPLFLLLLMLLGTAGMWGATIDFNKPNGYYYFGNQAGDNGVDAYDGSDFEANYYMCPAYNATVNEENYLGGDSSKPLITTLKTFAGNVYSDAVWYIENASNGYFRIKHRNTGKYLVANDNTSPAATRRRVNLSPITTPGDEGLFKIQSDDNGVTYYFYSKDKRDGNNKYICPSDGNKDCLYATDVKDKGSIGGILGFWSGKLTNSAWHIEPIQCQNPVITFNHTTSEVTITTATSGTPVIYYTMGDSPADPTESDTPYNPSSKPTVISDTKTIKAIATESHHEGNSGIISLTISTSPTIELTLPGGGYSYDGEAKIPSVTVKVNGVTISDSEYSVVYSDNTDAGTATVTIKDEEGGDYIIYGSTTFTINKANITPEVTIDSWGWNSPASAPSVTGNTGNATVTFEYKEKDAADGTYTETVPNAIGDYTVRATIPATTNYNGATVTADFSITRRRFGDGVRALPGFDIKMTPSGGGYEITVKDGETTLADNTDYEILEEGDYVIVSGIGNYTGSAKFVYASAVFARPGNTGDYAATYCSGLDIVANGVRPYVVKKVNTSIGTVTVAELSYIPEGVPVLLLSAEELSGFAASPTDESTPAISPSTLSGNLLLTAPGGGVEVKFAEAYVFYKGEFVLTLEGEIGAGRFFFYNPNYTPAPSSGGEARRYLRIVKEEEDATGIDNGEFPILNSQIPVSNEIHNLSGHRVNGPLPRGIYIVNGQKKLIK